jgi:hypothetical protein
MSAPVSTPAPLSARTALSRVYGQTPQGFPASLALHALDVDRRREGALEALTDSVALAERAGRIAPGKLPALLAAIGASACSPTTHGSMPQPSDSFGVFLVGILVAMVLWVLFRGRSTKPAVDGRSCSSGCCGRMPDGSGPRYVVEGCPVHDRKAEP